MTFFLKDPETLPSIPAPNRLEPTSFLQGLGAGFEKAALENDANFRLAREQTAERAALLDQAYPLLDQEVLVRRLKERGIVPETQEAVPAEALRQNKAGADVVLELAREEAQANPTAWQGIDLSDEGMQKRIDARLQAEHRDTQASLEMMGWGRGVAEFVGGAAGVTLDIKNAIFAPIGGGSGSILKIMGREAAINMAAEAAFLPSQFQMAERLNIPDPDVSSQLLMAAAGGAAIGGAVEGFGRAWTYWRGRNQTPAMEGFEAFEIEGAIDAAEEAMLAGENPLEAVERAMQGRGSLAEEVTPEPTALAPEPVSTGPIERAPLIPDEVMSPAVPAAEGLTPQTVTAQPTLKQTLKGRPKGPAPSNLSTFIVNRGGIWKGSDRGDLAAMDYRRPGFLKSKKRVQSSAGDNGGGLTVDEMREAAVEAGYLPEGASINDFLDAVARDAGGQRVYAQADIAAAMDAEAYRAARLDEDRPDTATADYLAMEPAPRGLFIDLEKGDGFLTEDDIASKVNGWIDESEFATILTPSERAEIISTVQARGGDVEYLVERVLEREADYVEAPDAEANRAAEQAAFEDGRGAYPPGTFPGEAGSSGTGQGGRAGADPAQLPGFDRIQTGDAQRNAATVAALQQQSKIRRLDQTRVEDDAGGLFGGAQRDMFSDPVGKAARPVQDQMAADLRDFAEQNGDPVIDAGDGKGPRSVSTILADLDAGDDFADMLDLCGGKRE